MNVQNCPNCGRDDAFETRTIDDNTRSQLCTACGWEGDKFDVTETVTFQAKPRKQRKDKGVGRIPKPRTHKVTAPVVTPSPRRASPDKKDA